MRWSFRVPAAIVAAGLLLSACGGGGGSSVSPGTPTGKSTANPITPTSTAVAKATFSVSFLQYAPVQTSSHRRAQFISPATQSIVLTLVSVNGATPSSPVTTTLNVGASDTGCTTSGAQVTCSTSFDAPVGNDVLTAASYSGPNGTGGSPLGTATVAETVQSNATNDVALDIGGVIANLQMFLLQSSFTQGTAGTSLVVIVPLDASGAQIVNPGNYSPSIAVTETGSSAFSLILDGAASGTSATVQSPSDQLVLSYSGTGSGSTNITATAGTGITATVNAGASGTAGLSSSITGNTSSTPNHFQFTSLGQTGTLSVSGGTPPYTVTSSDTTVASVSGSSGSYTITPTGYGISGLGTATLTITDSASPTPAIRTESVTVVPPTLASGVSACGSSATCTATSESFTSGTSSGLASTFSLTGGTGTYAYAFVSSGTTTSPYATASIAGSTLTVTPNGAGSDVLLVTSGSQTQLVAINDTPPATGGYAIASTAHAYAPSANTLTMSYNTADQATATLTTSTGSAPWTVTSSNPSVVTVTASQSGYLLTATGTGTATVTLTPATGTAPTPLAVTVIPNLSLSASSIALHAIGDAYSVTTSNATPGGLVVASSSITESPSGIVSLSFSAPTLSGAALTTGSTSLIFRDTNVDRKVVASLSVDSSYATSLETALAAYSQTTALGLPASVPASFSGLPTWISSVSATGGLSGAVSFASQTLSITSNPATTGTLTFADTIGGSVALPYAVLSFSYTYPGAIIGAVANEAFTAVGQTDTVGVSDGTAGHSYTATSSSPSVVTASGGSGVVHLTAVSAGTATITVVDTSQGNAATTFTVSVTTTTIPIASRNRQ